MIINTGGQQVILENYVPLDEQMDQAFRELYISFYNDLITKQDKFLLEILPAFENPMHLFFNRTIGNYAKQDAVFTDLTIIWGNYMKNGQLGQAQSVWHNIILSTIKWERQKEQRIHKGSVFYFWGVTAILQGEIDKGFFLMHSALDEDKLTSGLDFPNTPAAAFVSLDFDVQAQYFHDYTRLLAEFFDSFFNDYRITRVSQITLQDFRRLFLANPPSTDTVFSLVHSIATLSSLEL